MEISREEFAIIEKVIYPVVLRSLEISFNNRINLSQDSFEAMVSGRYHDEWMNKASHDFLNSMIKPMAWEVWGQISRIAGIYENTDIIKFTEKQLERVIIVTAITHWENFYYIRNREQKAYTYGKNEGFKKGVLVGFAFVLIILIILYNVL